MKGKERKTTVRGIRGAITVRENSRRAIVEATARLLRAMVRANGVRKEEIVSALLTATDDLDAVFPAQALRRLGWRDVPVLCAREIRVPDGLPRTVRALLHVSTDRTQREIRHTYLSGATKLRPDLARRAARRRS